MVEKSQELVIGTSFWCAQPPKSQNCFSILLHLLTLQPSTKMMILSKIKSIKKHIDIMDVKSLVNKNDQTSCRDTFLMLWSSADGDSS